MTFIDKEVGGPTTTQIVFFSILSALFLLCSLLAFHRGHTRIHYRTIPSIRFLFPIVCLICMIENLALALSRIIIKNETNDSVPVKIVFVLQAFECPILLLVMFEFTYLVHKCRSVNFCGMFFDEGRRVQNVITTPMKSFIARNFIRILALCLTAISVAVNLDLILNADPLAGIAGWPNLWNTSPKHWTKQKTHLLFSLIPGFILFFSSLYLSRKLWRYGSISSLHVHPTIYNPWSLPFVGTIILGGSQLFSADWYPFTSNLGLFIYISMILRVMSEIDKEMKLDNSFTDFLHRVAAKGVSTSAFRSQNHGDNLSDV